jgi:hypothetical protein
MSFEDFHAGQIIDISGGENRVWRLLDAGIFSAPLPGGKYLVKFARKEMLSITEWYYGTAYAEMPMRRSCEVFGDRHRERIWREVERQMAFRQYGTAYDDGDPFIITDICRLDCGGTIEALAANRQGLKSVVHILYRGREVRA